MTMPTVTEMAQRLEAVAPDPFIAEIEQGDPKPAPHRREGSSGDADPGTTGAPSS